MTMKKVLSLLMAMTFAATLSARPVGQETAKSLVQSFVRANFEISRQSDNLTLVKTGYSDRGEACYYIFNVGETGFVIFAADDCVRPIIGYSSEGTFNPDDMAPALADYLERTRLGIMSKAQKGEGSAEAAADWAMLEQCGRPVSRHGGREAEYLVKTKWNQNYPYNYYCPVAPSGPGGHVYAGCVATAAAQVMKYWDHPLQGTGSYTYTPTDYPEYGPQTANFGATTYDWDNMPNSISSSSPLVQIQAIALLQYHAGVSVNMNYSPSGSGAATNRLTERMPMYFGYTNAMTVIERDGCTHEEYMQHLINTFDMGWPIVHAGGGHAYVFDGYDDFDQIHANWGWSGSSDGWFNVDDHGYTDGQRGIFNYVPAEVYAATASSPTGVTAVGTGDSNLSATITWTNPTQTLTGVALESIDKIVVTRNGINVFESDDVAPGEAMSFTDESIPYYDAYTYSVYAVKDGQRGTSAVAEKVIVGPTCDWKIVMQTSAFQGWNGGYVSLYTNAGTETTRLTLTNSTPATLTFAVPVGNVSFAWSEPRQSVNNISFVIKDSEGNSVYTYSGNTNGLKPGVFFTTNNSCGNEHPTGAPSNLMAEMVEGDAVLTWDAEGYAPEYGHNIYRNGRLYAFTTETSFVDAGISEGHCYMVTGLCQGGETEFSNETCASSGDCMAPSNLWYDYVGINYKIKLMWDKPEPHDGLSGYYLYRKFGEDGTYERVKLLSASATSYQDNTANQQGDYYYRLYAYYSQNDCTSAPASIKYNPNLFYLHTYYSPTDVEETKTPSIVLYPNPADHTLKLDAAEMKNVVISNVLGQVVYQQECEANSLVINTSDMIEGLYLVTIRTSQGTVSRRVSIVH